MNNIDLGKLLDVAGNIVKGVILPEDKNNKVFIGMSDLVDGDSIDTRFEPNGDNFIITVKCKNAKFKTDDWFETIDLDSASMYLNACGIGEEQKKSIFIAIATIKVAGVLQDIQPLIN